VQQAVTDARGGLIGVVRVGLLTDAIDQAVRVRVEPADTTDPHLVFLCDAQGRLLSRVGAKDRLELSGDDLRFVPTDPPAQLTAALALRLLSRLAAGEEATDSDLVVAGHKYLATFRRLAETQDWIVGILVPEEHYTARLQAIRNRFLALYLAVAFLALATGFVATRAVRRGLGRVQESATRMLAFDFRPETPVATFPDVEVVLDGLERAKTAMRALSKYTPLDLVRELVRSNVEPRLGGRLAEVTVMFSDIQGFTNLAERVTPDELAELLGAYLEAMTEAIRATGGVIDKFIGDAVMALWNAPGSVADHPRQACRAVLACVSATRALYASPRWRGLPPLVTRFGVHTDQVLVGHFGAPQRMNYTALGDGVNLASRLEALGKQYGVVALVSEAVAHGLERDFALRRLDKVAVKGKSKAVVVYELLGSADARTQTVAAYEGALEDYFARRFDEAIARLEPQAGTDPPSGVLLARCRQLRESPPTPEWDGVFVATSK
jgi:adenylate cyclase